MSSIKEITKAWWIASNPTPKQSLLAQKRLEICNGCESMIQSVVFKYKCKEWWVPNWQENIY